MAQSNIFLLSPSDIVITELFDSLEDELGSKASYHISGLSTHLLRDGSNFLEILEYKGKMFSHISISKSDISITYIQNKTVDADGRQKPHPYLSTIQVNTSTSSAQNDTIIININKIICDFISKSNLSPGDISQNTRDELTPSLAVLSSIQTSSIDQIARTNDFFRKLIEEFDQKRASLDKYYDEKSQDLELKKSQKMDELAEQERALNDERKKLDDRNNTHARRAIRGELITTIQDRQKKFSVSDDTKALRWPIHLIFIALCASTFAGAVWSIYVWGVHPSDAWGPVTITSAVKTIAFTFGFLTSAGLYISWMNRWFDKHAEAQFQTKQFEIDINRASWAVEAALEWKAIQGEQMPDALLSGITKHLFETHVGESPEYSPLEVLATSILGSASNLKMNMNGNEMSFDRKGIKKIAKAGE